MDGSARAYHGPFIAIALAASAVGWAWHQAGVIEPSSAGTELAALAGPAEGTGHGNYCFIAERGAYFYGRDFDEKTGAYERFAEWCRRHEGTIGWVE